MIGNAEHLSTKTRPLTLRRVCGTGERGAKPQVDMRRTADLPFATISPWAAREESALQPGKVLVGRTQDRDQRLVADDALLQQSGPEVAAAGIDCPV
jgi:hypothetical protein